MARIKVDNLEKKILRREVVYGDDVLVINEIPFKLKNQMVKYMIDCIQQNIEVDEKQIILDMVEHCTNIDFQGDIFEIVQPSYEVELVLNELMLMFQELINECYSIILLALEESKSEMLQKEIREKKDEIVDYTEKLKDEQKLEELSEKVENKENEVEEKVVDIKEVKKEIKKPNRSRRRGATVRK